jgi:hypothetical protein
MMDPSEMIEVTEEQFQSDFDNYMEQIESNGTHYLIRRSDGTAVVAAPITEELEPLLDMMPEMPYNGGVDEELSI